MILLLILTLSNLLINETYAARPRFRREKHSRARLNTEDYPNRETSESRSKLSATTILIRYR